MPTKARSVLDGHRQPVCRADRQSVTFDLLSIGDRGSLRRDLDQHQTEPRFARDFVVDDPVYASGTCLNSRPRGVFQVPRLSQKAID